MLVLQLIHLQMNDENRGPPQGRYIQRPNGVLLDGRELMSTSAVLQYKQQMALLNVFNFIKYSYHLASNDGFTKCLYYLFHIDIRVELLSRCWVTAFTQKPCSKQFFFSHVSINMYETQRPLLFCVVLFTVEAGKHHLFCFLFIVFICLEENKIIFHAFFTYIHLRFLQFIDQN